MDPLAEMRKAIYSLDLPDGDKKQLWVDYKATQRVVGDLVTTQALYKDAERMRRYRARKEAALKQVPAPAWAKRRRLPNRQKAT